MEKIKTICSTYMAASGLASGLQKDEQVRALTIAAEFKISSYIRCVVYAVCINIF